MDNQGLFDAMGDSAVLLDKAGRVVNWNGGATSMFGYARKDVIGRSINLIYDRNYPFPKLIQEIQSSQKKWQEDTVFIRKSGTKGYCKSLLCPLAPNDQNKAIAVLVLQNMSAQKKAEEELRNTRDKPLAQLQRSVSGFWAANSIILDLLNSLEQTERKLRESELRFHLLAQNATDIISRHTPDGTYLYASPAPKSAIGFDPDNLIGKNIHKFVHHDDQAKLQKSFTRRREDKNNKPIT